MKGKMQELVTRFVSFKFLRIILTPVTILFTTPVRLIQSIWNCRILSKGQWGNYHNFAANLGLDYLFYWIQSVNIQRYGRHGVSRELSLGKFPLSKMFYMTGLSFRLYHKLGSMSIIIGMFGWLAAHLLWFDMNEIGILYGISALALCLISTTFYVNLFERQNYNVFGWMFFPAGLFGILTGNYFLASMAWLGASFGSFTVFYLSFWVTLAVALLKLDWFVLLTLSPGIIKIATHFFPLFTEGNLRESIGNTAKLIGVRKKAKYKRTKLKLVGGSYLVGGLYLLGLWGILCAAIYFWAHPIFGFVKWQQACLVALAPLFLFLNKHVSRFADDHNLYMFFLSLSTAVMMLQNNIVLLPFYWIAISPVPLKLGFSESDVFDIVPKKEPFFVCHLIHSVEKFLHQVPSNSQVLFAWEDPKGKYHNIFDGYRAPLQLLLYVAACRKIHLFPDWYAILENNYQGAPDFWGRDIEQVITNVDKWDVDFVIIYQESGSELDPKWAKNGFLKLNVLSWRDLEPELKGQQPFRGPWPDWWLLKVPESEKTLKNHQADLTDFHQILTDTAENSCECI